MKCDAKELLRYAHKNIYAHNCLRASGYLTPISQEELDSEWATEADVVEYIENGLKDDTEWVFVCYTEFGWFVQEMVLTDEPSTDKPSYSLYWEDWYKDGQLMDFEVESPFEYFN